MASGNLQNPTIKTLLASAAQTTTVTTPAFSIQLADAYTFILSSVTVTGTSPTLDVVLQTSIDGGTTYVNVPWRFAQQTAASVSFITVRLGLGVGEAGVASAVVAATGGVLANPCVVDPNFMKAVLTIGGTSPSFTVALLVNRLAKGSQAGF